MRRVDDRHARMGNSGQTGDGSRFRRVRVDQVGPDRAHRACERSDRPGVLHWAHGTHELEPHRRNAEQSCVVTVQRSCDDDVEAMARQALYQVANVPKDAALRWLRDKEDARRRSGG